MEANPTKNENDVTQIQMPDLRMGTLSYTFAEKKTQRQIWIEANLKIPENEQLNNATVAQKCEDFRFNILQKKIFGKNINYLIGGYMSNPYTELLTCNSVLMNTLLSFGWHFGLNAEDGHCEQHERALRRHIVKGNWEEEKICECVFHYKKEQCDACNNICENK